MKRILTLVLAIAVVFGMSYTAQAKKRYVFGGGPAGGTFQVVANGIQVFGPIKSNPDSASRRSLPAVPSKICVPPTPVAWLFHGVCRSRFPRPQWADEERSQQV